MRFLVDECTGPAVARWLRSRGHEVFSVYEEARGIEDDDIIRKAFAENWILATNDKGFGEKVCRERHPHRGVVLLRLDDERAKHKIEVIDRLLDGYGNRLADQFVTVTETQVRFVRAEGGDATQASAERQT
jgi:predicted nuclease of predicted toxin-antitoxin system